MHHLGARERATCPITPSKCRPECSSRAWFGRDSTVDAGELYSVANALGMSDQQVRLCIRRLVTDGQFVQEGRGRRAVLRATENCEIAVSPNVEFVRFMYAQDRGDAPWDGKWRLAGFAIPEPMRQARDAMREGIVHLGGAAVQGGLYLSANPWEDHVRVLASRLGVSEHLSYITTEDASFRGIADPRAIAALFWPLATIADGHRRLSTVAQDRLARLRSTDRTDETEIMTIAIELASEFTRATAPDPLLPPELLPDPWPGRDARRYVAECWSILVDASPKSAEPRLFRAYSDVVAEITGKRRQRG